MKPEEMVGRRVAEIRERLGMTQEQLGERLGEVLGKPWPRQTVSSAEKGRRAFTAVDLIALGLALHTSASRLLLAPMELEELEMPGCVLRGRNAVTAALGYRGGDVGERFAGIHAVGKATEAIRDVAGRAAGRIEADQKELIWLRELYEDLAEREFPEPETKAAEEGEESAS